MFNSNQVRSICAVASRNRHRRCLLVARGWSRVGRRAWVVAQIAGRRYNSRGASVVAAASRHRCFECCGARRSLRAAGTWAKSIHSRWRHRMSGEATFFLVLPCSSFCFLVLPCSSFCFRRSVLRFLRRSAVLRAAAAAPVKHYCGIGSRIGAFSLKEASPLFPFMRYRTVKRFGTPGTGSPPKLLL